MTETAPLETVIPCRPRSVKSHKAVGQRKVKGQRAFAASRLNAGLTVEFFDIHIVLNPVNQWRSREPLEAHALVHR